ncbi:RimK family alpha-L-glutamate ligase [Streptomyces sp. NBC_00887]|uniref:ATP-grasp domain-containing protein n=1 Tax=Streptomyces sp. NBC_00887 TaxID=2975859 RepID=UPI00386B2993|nr:glutathione synthase [Streptomyces sp. NBC_00887]
MILLWGLLQDMPLARVHAELQRLGAPVVFVDQRAVLDSGIRVEVDDDIRGVLTVGDVEVDLMDVTAAYVRPYDSWRIGAVARAGRDSDECRHTAQFDDSLWLWCELTAARVVNRPSRMAGNASKPRQSTALRAHGFRVPDTLITTDADEARAFAAGHESVVYKSVSGVRSIVSRLRPDEERLADLAWCPTQFQEHVPGVDYRVHVVGDDVFCSRIESGADDYRYAARQGAEVSLSPACLPDDLPDRCRELAADLGLPLAGIDLRLTPDAAWYCFEVNPSPAFTFYDRHGQDIAGSVARLLQAEAA